MTEKRFKNVEENLEWGTVQYFTYYDEKITDKEIEKLVNHLLNQNEQLKSTIAQLIEQNRKNNDLLLYDIRILEKALWCGGCENDYGRLKELRKEFIR